MSNRILEENRAMRAALEAEGLSPEDLGGPTVEGASAENAWLRELAKWTDAYRRCPDRRKLEKQGFLYPPVDPDIDPDSDWLRFERWMQGKPLGWSYVSDFGELTPAEKFTDDQLDLELDRITSRLAERGVSIGLEAMLPSRVAYACLKKMLVETELEFLPPGTTCVLSGCDGYCPDCAQRPWCEMGQESDWPEDSEAGHTVCSGAAAAGDMAGPYLPVRAGVPGL